MLGQCWTSKVCTKFSVDDSVDDVNFAAAHNRVDGLIGFADEVRLSHHCTYGPRIQRFIKMWSYLFVIGNHGFVSSPDKPFNGDRCA